MELKTIQKIRNKIIKCFMCLSFVIIIGLFKLLFPFVVIIKWFFSNKSFKNEWKEEHKKFEADNKFMYKGL